jgi:hypothetical protein
VPSGGAYWCESRQALCLFTHKHIWQREQSASTVPPSEQRGTNETFSSVDAIEISSFAVAGAPRERKSTMRASVGRRKRLSGSDLLYLSGVCAPDGNQLTRRRQKRERDATRTMRFSIAKIVNLLMKAGSGCLSFFLLPLWVAEETEFSCQIHAYWLSLHADESHLMRDIEFFQQTLN